MENDHLADALLFLRNALTTLAKGGAIDHRHIEGAIREIGLAQANEAASLARVAKMREALTALKTDQGHVHLSDYTWFIVKTALALPIDSTALQERDRAGDGE